MTIGVLRERLVLEQPVRTPDDGGGATVTWSTVAEVWAQVRAITGHERLDHDQVSGRLTHRITLRHRTDVLPAMRLRRGTHVYEIVAVIERMPRQRLECLCEERTL